MFTFLEGSSMILEQFTFVHRYKRDSVISRVVDEIRAKCKEIYPNAIEPKLENHTTSIPPILAPLDEMRYMTIGLGIQDVLHGEVCSERNKAEVERLDFFRNPGNDALVLRLKVSAEYKEFVCFWRENMHKFTNWRFPPFGDTYNPHICIIEGPGLFEDIGKHMHEIEKLVQPINFYLPSPKVMIKVKKGNESCWEEFDPLMGL